MPEKFEKKKFVFNFRPLYFGADLIMEMSITITLQMQRQI